MPSNNLFNTIPGQGYNFNHINQQGQPMLIADETETGHV